VKEGDGWRAADDEVLRVSSGELGWLQSKARKRVRGMRQVERRCLEEWGGVRGHRRQRNRPEEPAAMADFGERFGQPCGVFFRGKREGRERGVGAL
jgi:hypothetical protein